MLKLARLLPALSLAVWVLAPGAATASASPALPSSMAAAGDSITTAFDVGWCCVLQNNPYVSWSTGTSDLIDSQYRRLLALNPNITGHAYNDAQFGATMAALDGQIWLAAFQQVQYLTILMGANDVCTRTIDGMTPTATFRAEFQKALIDFTILDPHARVFVSSIPNVEHLWQILHANPDVESVWSTFQICQSMLNPANTPADRQRVLAQEEADNKALAEVCHQFPSCRWDNLAAFRYDFTVEDASPVDFFHPSLAGQNVLAAVTWKASYWGNVRPVALTLPFPHG